MKVVISGSRTITDKSLVFNLLDSIPFKADTIIIGGARGVDTIAAEWARARGIPFTEMLADWTKWKKFAGFIRNSAMLKSADAVVAIWDGESRGTKHMITITQSAGKPLHIIKTTKTN